MSHPAQSKRITLYTKSECPLCDDAERIVMRCVARLNVLYEKVDISDSPSLQEEYGQTIPVVMIDDVPFFYGKVSEFRLRSLLAGEEPSGRYRAFLRSLPSLFRTLDP